MNLEQIESLREPLQALIDSGSRTNANKPQRYWYPLSMASYDVEEVLAAVDSLCSFRTTMWDKTAAFEASFALQVAGGGEAIMVNSGSSADLLVAFALVNPADGRLRPGDEVLLPSVTWPTQIWSSMMAGLRPRFVDTDPVTLNVDLDDLEAKIGPDTRALSLVHLMGNPCDMDRVLDICRRHELVLFEDCCESLGASFGGRPVGTFGVAGAFSFFFSHHITTMEGGMITTGDEELAELFRLLRAHGWARNARRPPTTELAGLDPRYTFLNWGFNVRPTELQAGFGQVQLERWPGFRAGRASNASYVAAAFDDLDGLTLMAETPGGECSWFGLPVMVSEDVPFTRDELTAHLEATGVETRPIVAGNVTRHPAAAMFPELGGHDLPGADAVHDRGFYVGLHPHEDHALLDRLVEELRAFTSRQA